MERGDDRACVSEVLLDHECGVLARSPAKRAPGGTRPVEASAIAVPKGQTSEQKQCQAKHREEQISADERRREAIRGKRR